MAANIKIEELKKEGRPTSIMGHSMGSFMVQRYLELYPDTVDRTILCGTNGGNGSQMKAAYCLASMRTNAHNWDKPDKFMTNAGLGPYSKAVKNRKTDLDWLSYNDENVTKYIADPYCGHMDTHVYGFICLLFWFIAAMVMAFTLPSISGDWLGALFPALMAFVLLLIVCFSGIIPGEKIFAKTASIYFFAGLSILLVCHFALVSNPRSVYLTLVALALPIIVSVFLSSFTALSWDDWSLAKWSDRYLVVQERYALKGDIQRSRVFAKEVSHGPLRFFL